MRGSSGSRSYYNGVRFQPFESQENHVRVGQLFSHNSRRTRTEVGGLNRGSLLETSNSFDIGEIREEGSARVYPRDLSANSTTFEKNETIIYGSSVSGLEP
jgi:hypothetical protein